MRVGEMETHCRKWKIDTLDEMGEIFRSWYRNSSRQLGELVADQKTRDSSDQISHLKTIEAQNEIKFWF